ncbi:MAG: hypothetical protein ABEJ95_02935 [Candidatus Nanohalobium sp.]
MTTSRIIETSLSDITIREVNVESAFAMLKRKFGVKLNNRKPVSQRNEILTKCVAHNILVLIKAAHTLGIQPDFENCADEILAQE